MDCSRVRLLVQLQNRDGGWPYRSGASWVEPTCFALLALQALGAAPESVARGTVWLRCLQQADGGWPPQAGIEQSSWVTALVVLSGAAGTPTPHMEEAVGWLVSRTGRETTLRFRIREWLLGNYSEWKGIPEAWPWVAGTAAWPIPTALTILALEKIQRRRPADRIIERIESGRRFLLSRMCSDGGWNYGAPRALEVDAPSYPETTGQVLLGLHKANPAILARSLDRAAGHLKQCRSAEGSAWLRLALLAHGRRPEIPIALTERTTMDTALMILADQAAAGKNMLWE